MEWEICEESLKGKGKVKQKNQRKERAENVKQVKKRSVVDWGRLETPWVERKLVLGVPV